MRRLSTRVMTALVPLLLAGTVSACGSSSAPSVPVTNVTGLWDGFFAVTGPVSVPTDDEQLSVNIIQNGTAVSGVWIECKIVPYGCGPGTPGTTTNTQQLAGTVTGSTLTFTVPFVEGCAQIQATVTLVPDANAIDDGTWTGIQCKPVLSGLVDLNRPTSTTSRRH